MKTKIPNLGLITGHSLANAFSKSRVVEIVALNVGSTTEDLRSYVRTHGRRLRTAATYATVNGYDNDPRELWQIPEVVALCERVIESGLISLFHSNLEDRVPMLWGAWDVYMAATGSIRPVRRSGQTSGICEPSPLVFEAFVNDVLPAATARVDALLAEVSA